jgi:hypothetical protein
MKAKLVAAPMLALATFAVTPSSAQTLKPGLWEIKTAGHGGAGSGKAMSEQMARMKNQIAAMPAEQRKQFEAAIQASEANDVRFTDEGMTMKHCIGKNDAVEFHELVTRDGNCTSQRSPMVGGVVKLDISCTTPPASGTGTIRFQGDTGYAMEMTMTAKFSGGRHTSKLGASGKWLDADCGKVKPAVRGQ